MIPRRPLHLEPVTAGTACTYLLATLVAFVAKRGLQALVERRGPPLFDTIASVADHLGSGLATVGLGLTALALGRLASKPAWVDMALTLGARGIPCWILTTAGQIVFAESRPKEGGAMHWFAFGGHGVSGHAAAAALLFWTVRGTLVRDAEAPVRRAVTAAMLGWALLVGWSRVYLGEHFVWNVMLGYLVGTVTSVPRSSRVCRLRAPRILPPDSEHHDGPGAGHEDADRGDGHWGQSGA